MSRIAGACAVAAVVSVLLGACSADEPRPKMAPPTPVTPSPTSDPTSPSPSATAAVLGPEETVRAWVKARNVTVQNGQTEAVYALSAADCGTCRDSVEPVAAVYAQGGRYETFGWRIAAMKLDEASDGTAPEVDVGLVYTAGRTFQEAGVAPVPYEIERHIATFRLVREQGVWKIRQLVYRS